MKHLSSNLLLLVILIITSPILQAQYINVTSPNGGEVWLALTNQTIKWKSSGTSGYVHIEYSTSNGSSWSDVISVTVDNGSYTWKVPTEQANNCLIRVSDTDGDPSDISDAAFTIGDVPGIIIDSLALVALYNSTNGQGWTDKTYWLAEPVRKWYGITVEDERVTRISLHNNQLAGPIPSEIGDLSHLQLLSLSHNQLTGNIPSEIGNLSHLEGLYLSFNQLAGSIPSTIGQLSNLERLQIGYNQLTGSIPAEIGNLSQLKELTLLCNQLSGNIPGEIGNLINLNILYLTSNQLTGTIPSEIWNLTNLIDLYFSHNQLTGNISPEIGNLSNLGSLWFTSNNLTGSIPSEIGNLSNLRYLYLDKNQLTGSIPYEIFSIAGLKGLSLGYNQLAGSIQDELGNLTDLNNLDLSYNRFEHLPDLTSLVNLTYVHFEGNKFTFEDIEPNINISSNVLVYSPQDSVGESENITLDAGDNYSMSVIVGGDNNIYQWYKDGTPLPGEQNNTLEIVNADLSDIGTFKCYITNTIATQLTLYSRPVKTTVRIPLQIISPNGGESWPGMTTHNIIWTSYGTSGYLRLEYSVDNGANWTDIEESIPDYGSYTWIVPDEQSINCLIRISDTDGEPADISDNVFTISEIPGIITDSLALVALYNSTDGPYWTNNTNWLSGPVDAWYGITVENGRVTRLTLNSNLLTGTIHPDIGNLSNLKELDLSQNQLSGNIPQETCSLTQLQYVKLNNNQLTGNIPSEIGNLTNLVNLNLGNNQLNGNIPHEIGNLINLEVLSLLNNNLNGSIPSELGNLYNLNALSLWGNQLSGTIPASLGDLLNLVVLWLSYNQLSGVIPVTLENLINLRSLGLHYNQLSGNIPSELIKLDKLESLDLANNQLTGTIPPELGELINLQYLYLNNNLLDGNIPPELGILINLKGLYIDNNQISGSVPAEINNLNKLVYLSISNNNLDELPYLSGLSELYSLRIQGNYFTFEDIEPNIAVASSYFTYSPQNLVGESQNIILDQGDNCTLSISAGGENNMYQWYKDGNPLPGKQNDTLKISNAHEPDEGIYECHITNLVATELTLYSNPIIIKVMSPFQVTSPNGGENWPALTMHDITWTSSGTSGYIRIEYSTDNGTDWYTITGSTDDDGTFTWLTPNEQSTNCLVRLSDTDGDPSDVSDAAFSIGEIPGIIIDSLALVAIYDNTDGPNWRYHTNWKTGPLSSWFGITVESGRVTQVNLADNRLTGNLPSEIEDLSELQILDLGSNYLTGSIPAEIGNLSNLQDLNFYMNEFTGNIPAEIGNLSGLRVLNLNYNQLTGNIISEIGKLANLQALELENNQLTGNIPSVIWNMTNLQTLSLGVNQLTGTIPSEIGNLSNLQNLSLRANKLTGNVPDEIGNLTNLQALKLDNNQLTGDIPSLIWNLYNLTTLDLSLNQLTGNIPSEIGNLSKLYNLLLAYNQLTGNIPPEIGNLSDLYYLHLGNNQLTGDLPIEIWNLYKLQFLWLDSNQFTGQIPPEIGNLSDLRFLFLSDNKLTGNLPDELANLTDLQFIYLGHNNFESLPVLSELVYPIVLSVEGNKLTFEDIEPNIGLSLVFNYVPQDSVGLKQFITISEGDEFSVSVSLGGTSNQYQWYKNGVAIPGANSAILTIPAATTSDAGSYECHITNSVATELTLYSRPITVAVIPNTHPVVTDIPDQTVDEGSTFASINLDDYVSDVETADADIIWSHSGNSELLVTIIDRVASITIPDINWNGSEVITFMATDDNAINPLSGSDAATFNVNAVNDAPVITGQNPLSVDEDQSLVLSLSDFSIIDMDNPSGPFIFAVNSGSNYIVSGTMITPAANYNGMLTIPVTVSDGIAVSNPFDATVTVSPVNDMPVITDIPNQSIGEGGSFSSINLDQYVSDIETADADIIWTHSGDSVLTVTITNRIATIAIPNITWNGTRTLTFTATDNDSLNPLSDSKIATFTVYRKNEVPVLGKIPDQIIFEGDTFEPIFLDDIAEDIETSDENIIWSYSGNQDLLISIEDRVATIATPDENWYGSERITFTATDDHPFDPLSEDTSVLLTVVAVNDAPFVSDIPDQILDLGCFSVQVDLDDFVDDLETNDENIIWTCTGNTHVQIEIIHGIAIFTLPDSTWHGSDTITFTAVDNDLSNPLSASKTIIFTIRDISGNALITVIDEVSPYPNPTDRFVMVPISNLHEGNLTIEITNLNGEILSIINDVISDGQVEIDMYDYYPGVYFIRVIDGDSAGIYKIIKK